MTMPEATSPALDLKDMHVRQSIHAEQVRLLFAQGLTAFVGGVAACVATALVLLGAVDTVLLICWTGAVLLLNVYLLVLLYYYNTRQPSNEDLKYYEIAYNLQAVLHGSAWGVLGPMVFAVDPNGLYSFALIVTMGMATGAIATTGSVLRTYLSYVIPVILPSSILMLSQGVGSMFFTLGVLMWIYIAIMFTAGVTFNRTVRDSLLLRFHNQSLVQSLIVQQDKTEKTLEELQGEVAERKKAQLALVDAVQKAEAANEAKSRFLANMSHEIRTPLTAIIGFSETLLDAKTTMDERVEGIRSIIRNGSHLLQLINDILDLSKIEAGKMEVTRVKTAYLDVLSEIESFVGFTARNKGIVFECLYQYPLPETIITDRLRLKQILINLCSNAIKFTANGGVYLSVKFDASTSTMVFSVKDTGIGLTEEQLSRIFKSFEQADTSTSRKFGGTGLGLAISRRLASMLNGTIEVESEFGKGSNFTLRIDVGSLDGVEMLNEARLLDATATKLAPPVSDDIVLAGNVLLVEDTVDNQRLFALYLRHLGISLTIASDGMQALSLAKQHDFDLVLMDMQMPVMDGETALRELRAMGYKKPVIVLTANAMHEDRARAMRIGFDDFVAKPVRKQELVAALAKYLPHVDKVATVTPLRSRLLAENDEFADIVQQFIDELPVHLRFVEQAFERQDWSSLKNRVHDLKGFGGSYGFNELTDIAQKAEFQIAKQSQDDIRNFLSQLRTLIDRIEKGREPK